MPLVLSLVRYCRGPANICFSPRPLWELVALLFPPLRVHISFPSLFGHYFEMFYSWFLQLTSLCDLLKCCFQVPLWDLMFLR